MSAYIPYLIVGLTTGSLYGLAAMGLVLTYKTSGLFNIAYGAQCALSAFLFYTLREKHGLPWPLAALIVIVVFATVSGLVLERLAAALAPATTTYKLVGTVGLFVAIVALVNFSYGTVAHTFTTFLPHGKAFSVDGNIVTVDNLIDFFLGLSAAAGMSVFFRVSRLGVEMRGVVDDPSLLAMSGSAPVRVRRASWLIGSVFAAVSGLLFASVQQQLDINILSLLVVQAFGAAAIGRFTNIPMAFAGGLIVGVVQNILSKEAGVHQSLAGIDTNAPFLFLFVVLVVSRPGRLAEIGQVLKARAVPVSTMSPRVRQVGYAVLLVVALVIPHLVGTKLVGWNAALTQVALFVSLNLLVRTSGQISLCHIAFAAMGAAGFAHMLSHGVPWGLAVLIGGLVCIPAALLISIPAIRLSGLYLGLATLGFGVLVAQYAYTKTWFFGGGIKTAEPHVLGIDDSNTRMYYLLLAIALAAIAVVSVIERTRLGRLLRGMSDSPVALSTLGTNVNVARVLVFVASGVLAGISGATYASLFGTTSQDAFPYVNSLLALAILAIAGRRTITVAVVGPLLLYVLPLYVSSPRVYSFLQIGFGLAAIAVAVLSRGQLRKALETWTSNAQDRLVGPATTRLAELADAPPRPLAKLRSLP